VEVDRFLFESVFVNTAFVNAIFLFFFSLPTYQNEFGVFCSLFEFFRVFIRSVRLINRRVISSFSGFGCSVFYIVCSDSKGKDDFCVV